MNPRTERYANRDPRLKVGAWADIDGRSIWVAGASENGLPYGLSKDEFLDASKEWGRVAVSDRARRVLKCVMGRWVAPGSMVEADHYVKKAGHGLSRDIFRSEVEIASAAGTSTLDVAVLLVGRDCVSGLDERTLREAELLRALSVLALPIRVPRLFGVFPDGAHIALVRSYERGIEVNPCAGRQIFVEPVEPWDIIGRVAASIHRVPVNRLPELRPAYVTRADHARDAVRKLDGLEGAEIGDARAWMLEHLSPEEPGVLVHGDLLGQNILLLAGASEAVIDWEYARVGDPAYDLAIVTRGVRRPFQVVGGDERLLESASFIVSSMALQVFSRLVR